MPEALKLQWHKYRSQDAGLIWLRGVIREAAAQEYNIELGFASQRLAAMGDALISQSTGRSAARVGKGLCGLSGCETSTNVFIAAYRRYD